MTPQEIRAELQEIANEDAHDELLYHLLYAYGITKTSITKLRNGDWNKSTTPGEVLYRGKIYYREANVTNDELLVALDNLSHSQLTKRWKPRLLLLSNGTQLAGRDMKRHTNFTAPISELADQYTFFLPLMGAEIYHSSNDNEADRNAAYELAKLYDLLVEENRTLYTAKLGGDSHLLNLFLARLLFCFFAEDTGIFATHNIFSDTIANEAMGDGSDMHLVLDQIFRRLSQQDGVWVGESYVGGFPYVNGGLFQDRIELPRFTKKSRDLLVKIGDLDWRNINPDIFGSMIQAVADADERSSLGMHYTSVPNIHKCIRPLFLDQLYEELEKHSDNERQLHKLLERISHMKFFDPACGSGNFLIITYKELRKLEIEIMQRILELNPGQIFMTNIDITNFYGIEIKHFAHEVAMLSLWLAEHQMNSVFQEELAGAASITPIIPLKKLQNIHQGNAARLDWEEVCPYHEGDEIYIIGNPPYMGSRIQEKEQKDDMEYVFTKDYKSMDYIAIWFYKAARYIEGTKAKYAFVTTSSINEGIAVALTWPRVLGGKLEIFFAYKPFKWVNSAKGNAGVTVSIVGVRNKSDDPKSIYTGDVITAAKNINAYLMDAPDVIIAPLNSPLNRKFPKMYFGNMPADGGKLLLTADEALKFRLDYPAEAEYVRPFIAGNEFLNGEKRYCIWLKDVNSEVISKSKILSDIVSQVYEIRLKSARPQLSKTPHLFAQITQPDNSNYILIPCTSSERRKYIPLGFFDANTVISNSAMAVYDAEPWLFGVLHSRMHMVWVDAVGGKLKTDYRYSAKLCYNTFPFPEITKAQEVLLTTA